MEEEMRSAKTLPGSSVTATLRQMVMAPVSAPQTAYWSRRCIKDRVWGRDADARSAER
jgi:hypothetical protein